MKKNKLFISIIALTGLLTLSNSIGYEVHATDQQVEKEFSNKKEALIEAIENIKKLNTLDTSHKDYIYSAMYIYNSLADEEKLQIDNSLINVLNDSFNTINSMLEAENFENDFKYLLNDPTFEYESCLENLQERYSTLSEKTKSYINIFTKENINTIKENSENLIPDIYYDFTNPNINGSQIVNQGSALNRNATLLGNANVDNGYLTFGSNSSSDGSCLKLPTYMFASATDFTMSLIYQKTISDDVGESVYSIGNSAFYSNSEKKNGVMAYYASFQKRGPFYNLAHKESTTEMGTGNQLVAQGNDLHTFKMTLRYLSKAKCIQIYEEDLDTKRVHFFNFCENSSTNKYKILDENNFDIQSMTENYLGAKGGSSRGTQSFRGKYLSFRYYSKLVTDREMYGSDDRKLTIGQDETLNYINNFQKINKSFINYKNEYAKVIDSYYNKMISCLYDYQKFFKPENVEYFMEAYNLIHATEES